MPFVAMSILEYHFGNTNGVLCLLSKQKRNAIKYLIMRHISDDDFMSHNELDVLRVGCCAVKQVKLPHAIIIIIVSG